MRDFMAEAKRFKALGDEKRLRILEATQGKGKTVEQLQEILGISQPAVSHHLLTLENADLIVRQRKGAYVTVVSKYY